MTHSEKEGVVMVYRVRLGAAVCVMWLLCCTRGTGVDAADAPVRIDPNTKCVDLSDLTGDLPLEVVRTTQILWPSEAWERSTWSGDEGREYSSPCVVWNEEEQAWFMYFHYYENQWATGGGHQRTALATCADLAENVWTPWTDERGKLVPVLPVTAERWMNSQSSYHAIQRLPDGRWLGFLRGTGGEFSETGKWLQDPCELGFAISTDGRRWDYGEANPVIHQEDGGGGRKGVYRPHFIGYLGDGEYLLCWSESHLYDGGAGVIYGRTKDFRTVTRDGRGYARWPMADGLISPWREGNRLYLFAGKYLHVMELPVGSEK